MKVAVFILSIIGLILIAENTIYPANECDKHGVFYITNCQ